PDGRQTRKDHRFEIIAGHARYVTPAGKGSDVEQYRPAPGGGTPRSVEPAIRLRGRDRDPGREQQHRCTRESGKREQALAAAPGERQGRITETKRNVSPELGCQMEQ